MGIWQVQVSRAYGQTSPAVVHIDPFAGAMAGHMPASIAPPPSGLTRTHIHPLRAPPSRVMPAEAQVQANPG
jgi:hypothetical protein